MRALRRSFVSYAIRGDPRVRSIGGPFPLGHAPLEGLAAGEAAASHPGGLQQAPKNPLNLVALPWRDVDPQAPGNHDGTWGQHPCHGRATALAIGDLLGKHVTWMDSSAQDIDACGGGL